MIKNSKKIVKVASAIIFGGFILLNCEPDADALGSQFFNGAEAVDASYDVIAYNVNNNDTIRADAAKLDSAVIGAFAESQFGKQKVDYVAQVRPSQFAPDFGTNAVLDSAVFVIKPAYYTGADSITTNTNENYLYSDGMDNVNVEAKQEFSRYKVRKYGNTKIGGNTELNIKVERVSDFLGANSEKIYSNKNVATSAVLGERPFRGEIHSVKISKKSDNSELLNIAPSFRIKLDSLTFQNDIIKKEKDPELGDAASFIRFFKGIKVSVAENDGYLFKILPGDVSILLYYKNDLIVGETTKRVQRVFGLNLGNPNVQFSQIHYNRTGTPSATLIGDKVNGDSRVYVQGMGGPGAGLKIPAATIADLKSKYQNDKIGIMSAKIRLYTDSENWNNKYTKPTFFIVKQDELNTFLPEMKSLIGAGNYRLIKVFDQNKNPTYYDVGITQSLKNFIESGETVRDFIMNIGAYTTNGQGTLLGMFSTDNQQNYNTRSYSPERIVFVGSAQTTDPLYNNRVKLMITYGKK